MYEFRPTTERIRNMAKLVRDRIIQVDTERVMNVTESYKKNANLPP
jgi:predicted nucleotidyltransferase